MPKRDNGNETPVFRAPSFGDRSGQVTNSEILKSPTYGVLAEFEFENLYSWCDGITVRNLTGLIIRALQLHFSQASYIHEQTLTPLVWTPGADTKIRIANFSDYNPRQDSQLPAIIVRRQALQTSRIAIGDVVAQRNDGSMSFTKLAACSVQVTCLAEADGVTENLAIEVFNTLSWLGPIFRTKLPFHDFQAIGLGDLSLLDGFGTRNAVPIQVQTVFEYSWDTTQTAPVLTGTSLSTQVIATP